MNNFVTDRSIPRVVINQALIERLKFDPLVHSCIARCLKRRRTDDHRVLERPRGGLRLRVDAMTHRTALHEDNRVMAILPRDGRGQAKEEPSFCAAASVRRLVRDGVDVPLASLFVAAVRPILPEAEGAKRARSASEAFLYRRLETLPETRGRFRLNADLAIPFDGFGRMEVDLLCEDSRVVVEIDGAQHLADPAAYRRDRRKDQLLQENGYLVLRCLAEDVAKELDSVLDGILRALSARRNTATVIPIAAVRRSGA